MHLSVLHLLCTPVRLSACPLLVYPLAPCPSVRLHLCLWLVPPVYGPLDTSLWSACHLSMIRLPPVYGPLATCL